MTEEYVDVDGGESDANGASRFGFIYLQNEKDYLEGDEIKNITQKPVMDRWMALLCVRD